MRLLLIFLFALVSADERFHFVHIPKSGGSTLTIYLRQYADCQPPGFCCTAPGLPVGICNETRLCEAVVGCTRHEPHIELLKDSSYHSVLSLRDPLQRAVSGFFYPYHHGSHTTFESYTRDPSYQNVAVKMLNGVAPYSSPPMGQKQLDRAISRLQQFEFIIFAEAMREGVSDMFSKLPGDRRPRFFSDARVGSNSRHNITEQQQQLFNELNQPDIKLYQQAVMLYCKTRGGTNFCLHNRLSGIRSKLDAMQFHIELQWQPPPQWTDVSCKDAYFHHFPGRYKPQRDAIVEKYFNSVQSFPALPDDVLIAFPYVSESQKPSLAERVYSFHNYTYINYLQGETEFERWWSKVGPLMDLLKAGVKQRYIVVHDASDVLLMHPPTQLIQYFEAYSCDILMGTTDADWPPEPSLARFERLVAPWSKHHAHITAGMFMARTDKLLAHMEALVEESKSQSGMFNDQRHWRRLHRHVYPLVKADSMCRIFTRHDQFMNAP